MRSPTHSVSRQRTRPALERLEDRLAPAVGLFIENFSNDHNPADPGFDLWDADPNTIAPDELLIQHTTGGQARLNFLPTAPSPPHHLLLIPGNDTVSFPVPGTQGGFAVDETVAAVGVEVLGLGNVRFNGAGGRHIDYSISSGGTWQHLLVTAQTPTADGSALGSIQQVVFSTFEALAIDDITVLVDIQRPNHAPVALGDHFLITPGTNQWQFNVLDNDSDPDGDAFEIIAYSIAGHGQVEPSIYPGHFYYTPSGDGARQDQFTYTIRDEHGATASATVFITINTKPDAPLLVYERPHDSFGAFDAVGLVESGHDDDGDPLTARLFLAPEHGSVVVRPDGSFTYTPTTPAGRVLPDRFHYVLNDGIEDSDSNLVVIQVANHVPEAFDEVIDVSHGTPGPLYGTLRFTDEDPVTMTLGGVQLIPDPITGTLVVYTAHGRLLVHDNRLLENLTSNVDFIYYPSTGELRGDDQFTFQVTDVYGASATATVQIRVPNYRPEVFIPTGQLAQTQVRGDSVLTPTGSTPVEGALFVFHDDVPSLLLDPQRDYPASILGLDHDGDPLTAVLASQPQYGTVALEPDGEFTYTPFPDTQLFRTDTFSYRLTDGVALSNDVIYVLIEQSLGQGQARSEAFSISYEDTRTFQLWELLANDRFNTGVRAEPFVPAIRLASSVDISFPHNNQQLVRLSDRDRLRRGDVVRRDDAFYFTFHPDVSEDEVGTTNFSYEFLYAPPGLPVDVTLAELRSSTPGRVLLDITRERESDTDGVDDVTEQWRPGPLFLPGDGNDDGVADYLQPNVATLPEDPLGDVHGWYVTLESSGGTTLFDVQALDLPQGSPAGVDFPIGMYTYSVVGLLPGEATTVTIYPERFVHLDTYYKFGREPADNVGTPDLNESTTPHWYEFLYDGTTGAELVNDLHGTTVAIILHFVDGQRGDDDGWSDGVITDPGGAALFVPVAGTDTYSVGEDSELSVPAAGVLANDTDALGRALAAVRVSGPAHGDLTLDADGGFRYRPHADFFGIDTFVYQAAAGAVVSAEAVVTITVTPVIDARLDILPGDALNRIPLKANGLLPVAILSTQQATGAAEDIDARTVDVATVRFGDPRVAARVAPVKSLVKDVDGDGDLDLVVAFSLVEILRTGALRADSARAALTAFTRLSAGRVPIVGMDTVIVTSWCPSPGSPLPCGAFPGNGCAAGRRAIDALFCALGSHKKELERVLLFPHLDCTPSRGRWG